MKRLLLTTLTMFACGDGSERPGPMLGSDAGEHELDASDGDGSGDAQTDAAPNDTCTTLPVPNDCQAPVGNALPQDLRCTGLYANWETRELACGVLPYVPAYQLWSDGADKQRYMWLPPGTKIDVSHPDAFVFPEGTRFWKEFRIVDGHGKRLGETRLLVKRKEFWSATTYVWSADGASATQSNDGVLNLDGTGHTVPTRDQCKQCHSGRADFVLGFDPILLGPGASGLTMQSLAERSLVEDPSQPEGSVSVALLGAVPPGTAVERAALGYLHANCGVSCHSQEPLAEAKTAGLDLRLEHGEYGTVATTDAYRTTLNQAYGTNAVLPTPVPAGGYVRIRPTDPVRSLLLARMKVRGMPQMPRIGTNVVDATGAAAVQAWIEQMTTDRGYPSPVP